MPKHSKPPVILIAGPVSRSLAELEEHDRCRLAIVNDGAAALAWVRETRPDVIVLDLELPDMSGIVVCRLMRDDPKVAHTVPLLLVSAGVPTPAQRVAGLSAGAWDFVRKDDGAEEMTLKVRTYIQAKRNIDLALAETVNELPSAMHSRVCDRLTLARRARELGALMARSRGSLACLVFEAQGPLSDESFGRALALSARLSDVVGMWGPTSLAVVAPNTDAAGAVLLARRIHHILEREWRTQGASPDAAPHIRVGYDVVSNATYRAADPLELFVHAGSALQSGIPDDRLPWVRRFEAAPVHSGATREIAKSPISVRSVE